MPTGYMLSLTIPLALASELQVEASTRGCSIQNIVRERIGAPPVSLGRPPVGVAAEMARLENEYRDLAVREERLKAADVSTPIAMETRKRWLIKRLYEGGLMTSKGEFVRDLPISEPKTEAQCPQDLRIRRYATLVKAAKGVDKWEERLELEAFREKHPDFIPPKKSKKK